MTTRTTVYPTTEQKALELAARSDTWSTGTARTATGAMVAINLFASESEPGRVHLTRIDGAGCTCDGAQKSRSGVCFHMKACALVMMRVREEAVAHFEAALAAEAAASEQYGLAEAY